MHACVCSLQKGVAYPYRCMLPQDRRQQYMRGIMTHLCGTVTQRYSYNTALLSSTAAHRMVQSNDSQYTAAVCEAF
jgi:hypothetical protein